MAADTNTVADIAVVERSIFEVCAASGVDPRPEHPANERIFHRQPGDGDGGFGSFRFWFATQRWEWSPEVYRMHGYTPGSVEPTTDLLLSHKHPDDREQVAATIARSLTQAKPFSSRHRFLDTAGTVHHVMLVSDLILDAQEIPVGTAGYYIDLESAIADTQALDNVVPELIEARARIEQAKGVLMRTYAIGADQAFAVLKWRSQETNLKLRDFADLLVNALVRVPTLPHPLLTEFDHLLLTLHENSDTHRPTGTQ